MASMYEKFREVKEKIQEKLVLKSHVLIIHCFCIHFCFESLDRYPTDISLHLCQC